jgi:hypothetical protein
MAVVVLLCPLFLILTGRRQALLVWLCLTCSVDIFNAHLLVNLPAAAITGLLLLPLTVRWMWAVVRTLSGRALLLKFAYVVLLGGVFGFIFPWPDYGLQLAFNQTAQGRSIIYLVHLLGDVSVAVYVADCVRGRGDMLRLLRYLVMGTSLASAAGVLSRYVAVDLYTLFTGLASQQTALRLHGLNYEPRGLGLMAAYGLVLSCALLAYRRSPWLMAAALLDAAALYLAVSLSAVAAAAAGLVGLVATYRRLRWPVVASLASLWLLLLALSTWAPGWQQQWALHAGDHETTEVTQSGANNWISRLAIRSGVFDAGAVLFLAQHPAYLLSGTGPGLITLPASEVEAHLPVYRWLWNQDASAGLAVPPTIGALREISDGGLVSLALWLCMYWVAWRKLVRLGGRDRAWEVAAAFLVGAACIYAVQASTVSAMAYLILGLGLAGDRLSRPSALLPARTGLTPAARLGTSVVA